jgi:formylglycine-generating enzyme required for sulfatase activity
MPVWLREHLVGTLDGAGARQIRRLLEEFIDAPRQPHRAGESLEFVRRTDQGGANAPIRDYVFLAFLEGRKPKPGEVQAPGWLARLLYPEGRREKGLRKTLWIALAVLLGGVVYLGAEWAARWRAPAKPAQWRSVPLPPGALPVPAATPGLARAVEIADSLVGASVDRSENVSFGALNEMALGAPFGGAQHRGATPPVGIQPGWIFDSSGGMVDLIYRDSVILIENVGGVVRRTLWAWRDLDGIFLIPSLRGSKAPSVNPKDGLTYIWIKPGKFMMGCSPGDQQCFSDEKPAHSVEITQGFWMGQTDVTQAAFRKVTGQSPSRFKGESKPVEQVTWTEAKNYCQAVGLGLPTEAQWEYAARAGSTGATYGELDQIAWYSANSGNSTHDVKGKLPNAWGLYDMLGNVWEWVADWYDEAYYGKSPARDPSGPSTGTLRVLRGGSWYDIPRLVRASYRLGVEPEFRYYGLGFRCAGELP